MANTQLQKVETIMFQINQEDSIGMSLMWKDGSLYLSISNIMITDGNTWYAIPFGELKDIEAVDDGSITLKIEGADIKIKGESAERLMALRHLLLPLIEQRAGDGEVMEELIKLLLLGIRDKRIIASLLKRDLETVAGLLEKSEELGYLSGELVTEKGKFLLSETERKIIEKAGVKI